MLSEQIVGTVPSPPCSRQLPFTHCCPFEQSSSPLQRTLPGPTEPASRMDRSCSAGIADPSSPAQPAMTHQAPNQIQITCRLMTFPTEDVQLSQIAIRVPTSFVYCSLSARLGQTQASLSVGSEGHMEDRVDIWTDGACSGNPGPGGWGAVLVWRGQEREISGGEPETTNNRMELMAAIEALQLLQRQTGVRLHTDSQYVMKGLTQWIHGWKRNGWMTKSGSEVKNTDLWKRLDALCTTYTVEWRWVKGHSGDPMNERADELARSGIPRRSN